MIQPIFIDPFSGPDQTTRALYLPHDGRPGCGYTLLVDEEIALYRLGIMPVRCKSCGELLTDCEAA